MIRNQRHIWRQKIWIKDSNLQIPSYVIMDKPFNFSPSIKIWYLKNRIKLNEIIYESVLKIVKCMCIYI